MRHALTCIAVVTLVGLTACEPGKKEIVQVGYRGLAQEINYDADQLAAMALINRAPAPLPPADANSPPAVWKNVHVLTDVNANELNRTMLAMTNWVAPKEGCAYCHNINAFDSDEKYPKVVARRMLEMTRKINTEYKSHVQGDRRDLFTCHRGSPVPQNGLWHFTDQNQYLRAYLDRPDVRVQSLTVAHSNENRSSIKQAEQTYALMMNVSTSLGVNCTFCHNSRSWATWQNAPPARITSLYGFRMVRDLNTNFLSPLEKVLPANRLGVNGDAPKLQCVTCHQGAFKPLYGAEMVKDYPALWGAHTWARGGANDTVSAGYHDLRGRDSLPLENGPRLAPETVMPKAAPVRN